MFYRLLILTLLTSLSFSITSHLSAASIWIEGEDAQIKKNRPHPWWYDKVKTDVLSGGKWISNFNKEKEGLVGYEFEVK